MRGYRLRGSRRWIEARESLTPAAAPSHPTRAEAGPAHLATLPDRTRIHRAGLRLRPRRLRGHTPTALPVLRHRARNPLRAPARRHHQPGRSLDRPGRPQPPDGPGRTGRRVQHPNPRPGRPVHRRIRRSTGRHGHHRGQDPARCPKANAIAERSIRTLHAELTDRTLILGTRHLRRVLTEYVRHYNQARPHRALSPQPPRPPADIVDLAQHRRIRRKPILGGLINENERARRLVINTLTESGQASTPTAHPHPRPLHHPRHHSSLSQGSTTSPAESGPM